MLKKKIISIVWLEQFWLWFLGSSIAVFGIQTLFLGLWKLPVIQYRIPFMSEVSGFDLAFAGLFAILFGFGTALFAIARKFNAASCSIGSGSGILALFTMLCPVCPVFFLAYFGLSTTVLALAPYFWWIRLLSIVLLGIGIFLLVKNFQPRKLPKADLHILFQKFAVVFVAVLFITNQAYAMQIGNTMIGHDMNGEIALSGDFAKDIASLVTPAQLPFYGPELGLDMSNLNAINASIAKLSKMAPKQGSNPIELTDEEMKRYVAIGTEPYITCEFCCGVKTLVREDGTPTCGCAHSIAMRGTAAYLIRNYPELTNADISYELMRQKGLYFPSQMQKRMAESLSGEKKDYLPDIKYLTMNLTEEEIKDLSEKAKKSGFVPDTKAPGMVGGC